MVLDNQQDNQDQVSAVSTATARTKSKAQSKRKQSTRKTSRSSRTRGKNSWLTDECVRGIIALATLFICIIVLVVSIVYKNTTLIVGSSSIGAITLRLVYQYYFGTIPPK